MAARVLVASTVTACVEVEWVDVVTSERVVVVGVVVVVAGHLRQLETQW